MRFRDPSGNGPISDFLAGGVDFFTLGATKAVREQAGGYNTFNVKIDPCSSSYKAGSVATLIASFYSGLGELESLINAGRGLEALEALGAAEEVGAAPAEVDWTLGAHKSATKWANRMAKGNWAPELITETINNGERFEVPNLVNPNNPAVRYVNPETGQYVVVDSVTGEVLQVSAPGYVPLEK